MASTCRRTCEMPLAEALGPRHNCQDIAIECNIEHTVCAYQRQLPPPEDSRGKGGWGVFSAAWVLNLVHAHTRHQHQHQPTCTCAVRGSVQHYKNTEQCAHGHTRTSRRCRRCGVAVRGHLASACASCWRRGDGDGHRRSGRGRVPRTQTFRTCRMTVRC